MGELCQISASTSSTLFFLILLPYFSSLLSPFSVLFLSLLFFQSFPSFSSSILFSSFFFSVYILHSLNFFSPFLLSLFYVFISFHLFLSSPKFFSPPPTHLDSDL